jgi:hypothetical protein
MTRKPTLILDGPSGRRAISVLEYDANGFGVRIHVLSDARSGVADSVMRNRFDHMLTLMGDNVDGDIRFSTQEDAEVEADALNSEEPGDVTWQVAYVNAAEGGDFWIVVATEGDEDADYGGRDTPSPELSWGG